MITGVEIQTGESICGIPLTFFKHGKTIIAGRKLLKTQGFTQCPNPFYMIKDGITVHYNRLSGIWIIN
mgnify:FL=1